MNLRMLLAVGVVAGLALLAPPGSACADHGVADMRLADQAVAYIPPSVVHTARPALLVVLHGAGQRSDQMIAQFKADADRTGMVLLAPKSAGPTWDIVAQVEMKALSGATNLDEAFRYGRSKAAARVLAARTDLDAIVKTDDARISLLGFSDGATFALALGPAASQPFSVVLAVAPGLVVVAARPALRRTTIVMHGRNDRALPFEVTRATIVPALRRSGLTVVFHPFDGGHEIPPNAWMTIEQLAAAAKLAGP
jgi:predicted esterase